MDPTARGWRIYLKCHSNECTALEKFIKFNNNYRYEYNGAPSIPPTDLWTTFDWFIACKRGTKGCDILISFCFRYFLFLFSDRYDRCSGGNAGNTFYIFVHTSVASSRTVIYFVSSGLPPVWQIRFRSRNLITSVIYIFEIKLSYNLWFSPEEQCNSLYKRYYVPNWVVK